MEVLKAISVCEDLWGSGRACEIFDSFIGE